jgi:putative tryptophan/tyrosine transport system substrate-binding protein
MRRRASIGFLGGAAAWPLAARAQQTKLARIGVLITANPEPFQTVFRQLLREQGLVEGQTVQFEFRSADGKAGLLPGLAEELVRLKVDILVVVQTPAAFAARQATSEIPIVMAGVADPVATGLIANLARPGGNITGVSGTTTELGAKMLELIRDMLPKTRRVAVLGNAPDPFTKAFIAQIELGGRMLGIAIQPLIVRAVDEYDSAFAAMIKERTDAVIVQPSLPRRAAIDLALKHRLPAVSPTRLFPGDGGLMSYSANLDEQYRLVASYIQRILKGAKPADLPVEQPTRFELIINRKTANALGIKIPNPLLVRADEVID